jgi:hypothetical protein
MKAILLNIDINIANTMGNKCPNLLTSIFLPVLEHFILPHQLNNNRYEVTANLASSLSFVSL